MIRLTDILKEMAIAPELYNKIKPDDRIVMSHDPLEDFRNVKQDKFKSDQRGDKPKGLWYALGTEWIDWVRDQVPKWEGNHIYRLELNESMILKVTDFKSFEDEYGYVEDYIRNSSLWRDDKKPKGINWERVSHEYYGVEVIAPFGGEIGNWNRTWDVSSGCVWNKRGIKKIEKIEV